MDRRGFLKLVVLLPFSKDAIKKLIADREAVLDSNFDWQDPIIVGGPVNVSEDPVWREYWDKQDNDSREQIFAPDPDRINEFIAVGRTSPLLDCDCFSGLDIQIKTGHCDESENLLDL